MPQLHFRPSLRRRLALLFFAQFLAATLALLLLTWLLFEYGPKTPATVIVKSAVGSDVVPAKMQGFTAAEITAIKRKQDIALQAERETLRQLLLRWLVAVALTALVAVGTGWWVAGRLLRPLNQITGAARRLSEATLNQRIGMAGPNHELKELADTFDGMLGRLQRAFESQRHFVANASHELRSPLAEQRALTDVTLADPAAREPELRAALSQVRASVDEQDRILEAMLTLARSERGLDGLAPVDLAELVERALLAASTEADSRGIRFEADVRNAAVAGDAALLERLVANLLDNAIRHNRDGGWVRVAVRSDHRTVLIEIGNGGEAIPPEAVAGLFEPFRRLGGERTDSRGLGLGLPIVRAVAAAHGGQARAKSGDQGGLIVTVSLSAAPGTTRRDPY